MIRRIRWLACLLAIAWLLPTGGVSAAALKPGTPDPSFAQTVPGFRASVNAVVEQPDGKILVAGSFTEYNGFPAPGLTRLNADGTRDPGFNQTGTGLNGQVSTLVLQPDGKILVGGYFSQYDSVAAQNLIRLNPDGSRDPSFAQAGTGLSDGVNALVLQGQKILVGGAFTAYDATTAAHLARLNADGGLDLSFENNGPNDAVNAIALHNGNVLIGGAFTKYKGVEATHLARLDGDGGLDLSFVRNGPNDAVNAIAVQSGKVLVGGNFTFYEGTPVSRLVRLDTNGSRDIGFTQTGTGLNDTVNAITVQTDNKILVGGSFTTYNGNAAPRLIRLDTNGPRDPGFTQTGTGLDNAVFSIAVQSGGTILAGGQASGYHGAGIQGLVRLNGTGARETSFPAVRVGLDDQVNAVATQPGGKILIGGTFTSYDGSATPFLARLNPDGTRDDTFNQTGLDGPVNAIAIQPDGKILIGGSFTKYNSTATPFLTRLKPDGSLDTFTQTGLNGPVNAIAIQPDGKILIGGNFTKYNSTATPFLTRLKPDGSLDTFTHTGLNAAVMSLALRPNGAIVAAGAFTADGSGDVAHLIQLTSGGSKDPTFSMTGTGLDAPALSVTVQPDGKVIVGGAFTKYNSTAVSFLVRLNTDGTRDGSFSGAATDQVWATASAAGGKVLIGGAFNGVRRLQADGSADSSFDAPANGSAHALASQSDATVLAGGDFTRVAGVPVAYVARLLGGPSTLAANPSAVTFADQAAGSSSAPTTVTVTNTGDAAVLFGSVSLTGPGAAQFGLTADTCTEARLAVGASCQVAVRFSPTGAGAKSATVQLNSNASGSPLSVALSGTSPSPVVTPPAKPTGLKAKAATKSVTGRWAASRGASTYSMTVKGKTPKGKKASKSTSTTGTSAKIKAKFKKKSKVTVCVVAKNTAGSSPKVCVKAKVK